MKKYVKYIVISLFFVFSIIYTNKVIEISQYNNTILTSINEYASLKDYRCREGSINNDGIILGISGLVVNKNKSYSNMKGIGFKEELLEFDKDECILNKKNNIDRYILKGNDYNKNVSIVINTDSGKYFNKMLDVSESKNIEINLLMNTSFLRDNITDNYNHSNILYKGSSSSDLNNFSSLLHNEFFCVKTNDYEIIHDCKNKKLNSIKMNNEIKKDLLINTKKLLNNGVIIFIRENEFNLSELSSTINYIKSRGFTIVNINELLS